MDCTYVFLLGTARQTRLWDGMDIHRKYSTNRGELEFLARGDSRGSVRERIENEIKKINKKRTLGGFSFSGLVFETR